MEMNKDNRGLASLGAWLIIEILRVILYAVIWIALGFKVLTLCVGISSALMALNYTYNSTMCALVWKQAEPMTNGTWRALYLTLTAAAFAIYFSI